MEKATVFLRKDLKIGFNIFWTLKEIQSEILIDIILADTSHIECVIIQAQAERLISQG